MITFSCFLHSSIHFYIFNICPIMCFPKGSPHKKNSLFFSHNRGTKLKSKKFMHLFVRTSPINRFCFDFQFYLLLILRWAPPNSACLFKLPLLRTWASSSQKFNHFGNRFKILIVFRILPASQSLMLPHAVIPLYFSQSMSLANCVRIMLLSCRIKPIKYKLLYHLFVCLFLCFR